jgi:hypothetical protein
MSCRLTTVLPFCYACNLLRPSRMRSECDQWRQAGNKNSVLQVHPTTSKLKLMQTLLLK